MLVDFTVKGKVIIDMVKYVESMVEAFPVKISKISKTPAVENLLDISTGKILDKGKLTLTIDAHENRDVMSADVPNASIKIEMPNLNEGEERMMMKIS